MEKTVSHQSSSITFLVFQLPYPAGIVLGELEGVNVYIFAVAGGMFLYISLVDMVPELNHEVEKHSRVSAKKALFTFFLQNVGIILGVFSLYVLAIFQDNIQL